MLTPGTWPILDHDDDPTDLISAMTAPADGRRRLPSRAVLAILGSRVAAHAASERLQRIDTIDLVTVSYPVFRAEQAGREVAVVEAPIGAPGAVMVAEHLYQRGVRIAVAVGSCGALRPLVEGTFIVPVRALRDEGTSYHYLPPGRWIETDAGVRAACHAAIRDRGHDSMDADVWTTDAIFRETRQVVDRRVAQGCAAVEMECAAWSAWAKVRRVRFGQILFTADSLAGDGYDPRDWGVDAHEVALRMAIDAAFAVAED